METIHYSISLEKPLIPVSSSTFFPYFDKVSMQSCFKENAKNTNVCETYFDFFASGPPSLAAFFLLFSSSTDFKRETYKERSKTVSYFVFFQTESLFKDLANKIN